jgi:hypothetical protein
MLEDGRNLPWSAPCLLPSVQMKKAGRDAMASSSSLLSRMPLCAVFRARPSAID